LRDTKWTWIVEFFLWICILVYVLIRVVGQTFIVLMLWFCRILLWLLNVLSLLKLLLNLSFLHITILVSRWVLSIRRLKFTYWCNLLDSFSVTKRLEMHCSTERRHRELISLELKLLLLLLLLLMLLINLIFLLHIWTIEYIRI